MKLNDLFNALNTQEMADINGGGYDENGWWHNHDQEPDNTGHGKTTNDDKPNTDEGYHNGQSFDSWWYDNGGYVDPNMLSDQGSYDYVNHIGNSGSPDTEYDSDGRLVHKY